MLIVAAATEADIAELESYEERQMFLEDLGLEESGVERLIKSAYKLLNLETFFTTGADETRAWTYSAGMKAPQTAGIIHTDFERGFIRAEVIKYDDYVARSAPRRPAAMRARSASRARSMSFRTATSCTSCSTSDRRRTTVDRTLKTISHEEREVSAHRPLRPSHAPSFWDAPTPTSTAHRTRFS